MVQDLGLGFRIQGLVFWVWGLERGVWGMTQGGALTRRNGGRHFRPGPCPPGPTRPGRAKSGFHPRLGRAEGGCEACGG